MTIEARQVKEWIIEPCLQELGLWSPSAETLVWGTGAIEGDGFNAIKQYGNGPALSWFGIEPNTYYDFLDNTVNGLRPSIRAALMGMVPKKYASWPRVEYLAQNQYFACAICRLLYYRISFPLPPNALALCAAYWKQWYNTPLGAGTVQEWIAKYNRYCN